LNELQASEPPTLFQRLDSKLSEFAHASEEAAGGACWAGARDVKAAIRKKNKSRVLTEIILKLSSETEGRKVE
jgi:hypothetical protein